MEWYFNGWGDGRFNGLGNYPLSCPKDELKQLTTLLLSNNYTPFAIDHNSRTITKLDTTISTLGTEWVLLDVLWLLEASLKNSSFLYDKEIVRTGYYSESTLSQHLKLVGVKGYYLLKGLGIV